MYAECMEILLVTCLWNDTMISQFRRLMVHRLKLGAVNVTLLFKHSIDSSNNEASYQHCMVLLSAFNYKTMFKMNLNELRAKHE